MSRTFILTVLSIATAASVAWAASVTVIQKGRSFGSEEISIRVGDEVTFVNDDVYPHNVYTESSAGSFDIGLQKPRGPRHLSVRRRLVRKPHPSEEGDGRVDPCLMSVHPR